jgi:hypothetical protein
MTILYLHPRIPVHCQLGYVIVSSSISMTLLGDLVYVSDGISTLMVDISKNSPLAETWYG